MAQLDAAALWARIKAIKEAQTDVDDDDGPPPVFVLEMPPGAEPVEGEDDDEVDEPGLKHSGAVYLPVERLVAQDATQLSIRLRFRHVPAVATGRDTRPYWYTVTMKPDAIQLCTGHTSLTAHVDALAQVLPTRVGSCAMLPYYLDRAHFACDCKMTWALADRLRLDTSFAFSIVLECDPDDKANNWIVVTLLHWCGRPSCVVKMRQQREAHCKRLTELCQRNEGRGPRICHVCGRTDDPLIDWYGDRQRLAAAGFAKMKSCARCRQVHYCSIACQREDYASHTQTCGQ